MEENQNNDIRYYNDCSGKLGGNFSNKIPSMDTFGDLSYLQPQENSATPTDHLYYGSMNPKTGWICPKCGRVYSPDIWDCKHCNKKIKKQEDKKGKENE